MSAVPTLTLDGFATNPNVIMRSLFEYFIASDYSQSNTFYGQIASLKYILSMNESKATYGIKEEIESSLTLMYRPYFDSVKVMADVKEMSERVVKIIINITASKDNVTYVLPESLKESIVSLDNYYKLLEERQKNNY